MIRLTQARRAAELLLTDRCRISDPPQARPTLDRDTMTATAAVGVVAYEGPCQVSYGAGRSNDDRPQERTVTDHPVLSVPYDVAALAVGQRVVVTRAAVPGLEHEDWTIDRIDTSSHSLLRTAILARTASRRAGGGAGQ